MGDFLGSFSQNTYNLQKTTAKIHEKGQSMNGGAGQAASVVNILSHRAR